jgi:hypothetical protein
MNISGGGEMKGKCYHRGATLLKIRTSTISMLLLTALSNGYAYAQTLPNPKLTPGAVRTTDKQDICSHGTRELRLYNTNRNASRERYAHVLRSYNFAYQQTGKRPAIELDHLVPLGIGGADEENNLWPQPKEEAELKDKLEWRMRDLVCKENVPPEKLQREIKENWWSAYQRYVKP